LRRVVKRQRTILGILIREARRKMLRKADNALALNSLQTWRERAERVCTQQRQDKNKLYALRAPEVECIGKCKARKPYEFGVKVSLAVIQKKGLLVGARSFTANPYHEHILAAQMAQSAIPLQGLDLSPKQAVVDLRFRGKEVDQANPDLEIFHRCRIKTMTKPQRRWLQGATGDALHAPCCAVDYDRRWLMRAVMRLGLRGLLSCLLWLANWVGLSVTKRTHAEVGNYGGPRHSGLALVSFGADSLKVNSARPTK
jgi:IS5 family transposase